MSFSIFALVCFASTFGGLMRSIWDANEKLVGLMVYIGFLKEKNWYKIQEICEKLNEKLEMQQNLRKKIDLFFTIS